LGFDLQYTYKKETKLNVGHIKNFKTKLKVRR